MNVATVTPALFTLDSSGHGEAAILQAGRVISLFATGAGIDPVPQVSVKIGGVECPVQYAGAAPGLIAAVLQINVLIPDTVPPGRQPVELTIAGVTSQAGVETWIN